MEIPKVLASEVFLDTSYTIALASPRDQHHARAAALADQMESQSTRMITTRGVCLEIGSALSRQSFRDSAIALLESLESDPRVEIVPLSEQIYARAFRLFRDRLDKEWGLTDCVSFVAMQQLGLTAALTSDDHFRQAGFRALLLDELPVT